jgi:hypothetical protein
VLCSTEGFTSDVTSHSDAVAVDLDQLYSGD